MVAQRFYGIRSVMKIFDISRQTVRNWVLAGKLPPPVKDGQTNLWIKSEIDQKVSELMERAKETEERDGKR